MENSSVGVMLMKVRKDFSKILRKFIEKVMWGTRLIIEVWVDGA